MAGIFGLIFLASLILLIIGLFAPQKSLFWDNSKPRTKKRSSIIYGLCILASFIGIGIFADSPKPKSDDNKSVTSTENKVSVPTVDKEEKNNKANEESVNPNEKPIESEVPTYNKIGDQIEVGNFSYVVNGVKYAKTLGNEFVRQTADGYFLVVDLTFRNNDNEEHTLDNSFFKLTDESGTEFSTSSEGATALEMSGSETLFLKSCNPQISKRGFVVFEVPEKKIFDIHLSGGFWNGKTALVKLTNK